MSAELPPDRALLGIMIYTFARVGVVLQMNVGDYLDEYIAAAGIADDKDGPLVSNHRALDRHAAPVDATGRLQADTALRKAGGYQNADRQSHYAGRRLAFRSEEDGESRRYQDHSAIR